MREYIFKDIDRYRGGPATRWACYGIHPNRYHPYMMYVQDEIESLVYSNGWLYVVELYLHLNEL